LKLRRALTAFMIVAHNLEIESGRYIHDKNILDNNCTIKCKVRFCKNFYEENKTKLMEDKRHAIISQLFLMVKYNNIVCKYTTLVWL